MLYAFNITSKTAAEVFLIYSIRSTYIDKEELAVLSGTVCVSNVTDGV